MADITNEFLLERLQQQFGEQIKSADVPYGMVTLVIEPSAILEMLTWLNKDNLLKFRFLTDICGSHHPDIKDGELCVIYHVQSMENNIRLRLKAFVPIDHPAIPSVTSLYSAANWMERETYDFYGVEFHRTSEFDENTQRGGNGLFPAAKGISIGRWDQRR